MLKNQKVQQKGFDKRSREIDKKITHLDKLTKANDKRRNIFLKDRSKNISKAEVTKEYFDKKFKESFKASKDYTDKRFERLFVYLDHRFAPLEAMAKEFHEFKERIETLIDRVLGKYEKLDQEHTIASEQYRESSDKLENHEVRITVLEKKAVYKTS